MIIYPSKQVEIAPENYNAFDGQIVTFYTSLTGQCSFKNCLLDLPTIVGLYLVQKTHEYTGCHLICMYHGNNYVPQTTMI